MAPSAPHVQFAADALTLPAGHGLQDELDSAPSALENRPGLQGVHPSFAVDALADE